MLERMETRQNRRTKRLPIHWPTTLVHSGVRRGCTIVDVSRAGARIKIAEPVAPGSRISLIDERVGALEATVMWCRGDMAGVAFLPLEPEVAGRLRNLLLRLEEAEAHRAAERPRPQFGRRGLPSK